MTPATVMVLQEATEAYLIQLLELVCYSHQTGHHPAERCAAGKKNSRGKNIDQCPVPQHSVLFRTTKPSQRDYTRKAIKILIKFLIHHPDSSLS